jgi:chemotaxis protein methyltransferase CheR
LAARGKPVAIWSAGCAAGEEPYSLRIAWEELPGKKPPLRLLATDVDTVSLERAAAGRYPESSLREVPDALRRKYFEREGETYRVRGNVRRAVSFRKMDLVRDGSPGRFGLILCRNAAFTYFGPDQRVSVASMLGTSLEEGGYLVLGRTETLPKEAADLFEPAFPAERIYRLRAGYSATPESRAGRSLGQIPRTGQLVTRPFRQ